MASISALIDFLMNLMSDEDTKRSFAGNPEQTMADKGLRDVSAQDVRDARLIMADQGSCRPRPDGGSQANGYHDGGLAAGGGSSAVREILHTTNTFEIDQSRHTDVNQNIFNIDNHRTTIIDSLNSQDKVIAIQDNDVTNNTDVDVNTGEDETDDTTEDKADDGTDTPDDTEVPPDPDGSDQPGPPTAEEPADGPFPTEPEPPASDEPAPGEPVDEDPGLDPDDGADAFPPEPEPMPEPEPVAEADELPVA